MDSSSQSETSSGSSLIQNSCSGEDVQALMDQRKRKKMISNRESARRSRIRKQNHLDDLVTMVDQLKEENQQILKSVEFTTQTYLNVEAENSVLRAQISELSFRISDIRIFEVFLSFRGEDTRASFVSHLYASLQNAGINVFKDDESLSRGDHISDSLLGAIRQSQISVVVFSRNYAGSQWCLKELEKIIECHRTIGQMVVPVFYDVDPSEVRHQTGEFGKSFQSLLNRIFTDEGEKVLSERGKVQLWREALREAASTSGIVVLNSRNENEAIKSIVENVTRLLDKTELFVVDNPVGVESRVQDTIQLLDLERSNDVLLLGMWGMGGIGKTTIAKAICNKIGRNFEGRSFLAHIREVWGKEGGQVCLQEQLLFDINKETKTKIHNVEFGKNILMKRLRHKRVLLILDDVNNLHQLNALCGNREWFGSGSRIIITTRDMHILRGCRVDKLYIMEKMDESESVELFSWHAFKQASPREDFDELSRSVIAYSGGLPLALEVLGSYLFDMEVTKWKSVLEKLKKIPNDEVQEKLKISYDGLSDNTEKEIFLDIACFFIGMDRNDVIHILNGSGLCAENGIRVLAERSLVTVDHKNKLGMHDLLRDMGREIIRGKSPKEPEERSRLWFHEDVLDVLSKKTVRPDGETTIHSGYSFPQLARICEEQQTKWQQQNNNHHKRHNNYLREKNPLNLRDKNSRAQASNQTPL